jgi:ABC-type amino acid transport substrate-binding protein
VPQGVFRGAARLVPALASASWLLVTLAPALDMPDIQAHGRLRVIVAEGEQPEMFDLEGDPAKPGLEREMLEGFARLKRLKLEVVPVKTFGERIPALYRGGGDMIAGLVETAERRRQVDFTAEVFPVHHVVGTLEPAPPVRTVEELRRKRVGTVRGTTGTSETLAAGVPGSQVEYFPDTGAMLEALSKGRVDSVVMRLSDLVLAAERHPGLEAGVRIGAPSRAAWGVRTQDPKLKAELDEYIENLRTGGSWNRLVLKYFGGKALTALGRE